MKVLFVYPRFSRHAEDNPELLGYVPMNEYFGSPSLGMASLAAVTPARYELEYRDDRIEPADRPTDADVVALSFFTPAARRGIELAQYFKALGKIVVAGGIFPTMLPNIVGPHVDAVVIGEGESSWPHLLDDIDHRCLRPIYVQSGSLDLESLPPPNLSLYFGAEVPGFEPDDYPVQISRGCALSCHSCALPVSMTKKMRAFSLENVVAQIEALSARNKRACLTEDTSWFIGSKGRNHLARVLDYLSEREGPAAISYIGISMPMILTTPEWMFEKARAAGVRMFYLVGGFDPITMNAFTRKHPAAKKRAEDAIKKSWDVGIEPYTSFLIGNDQDDEGTVDEILEFAARTKIRKSEFAIFTPYPGTPSWTRLLKENRIISFDWSKYNDANVVFRPKNMSPGRLRDDYLKLWRCFYSDKDELRALSTAERTIQF